MPNITAHKSYAIQTRAEKNDGQQAGEPVDVLPIVEEGGGGVGFGETEPLWQPDFMDPANSHYGSALTRSRTSVAYPIVWRQYNQMVFYQTSLNEIIVQGTKRSTRPYQDYDSVGDGSDDLHPKRTFGDSFIHDSYPNWKAATAYAVGDRIADVQNYMFYECTVAGTSGGTEPTWNLSDGVSTEPTTTDNTVTWVHKPAYIYTRYGGIKNYFIRNHDQRSDLDTVSGVDPQKWQEKNAVPASAFSQITTAGPTGSLFTYYGGSSLEINCPNTSTSPWIESAPSTTQYSNVWHFLITKSDNANQEGCLIGRNDDVDGIYFNPYDGSFSAWSTAFSGVEYHARLIDNSIWAVTLDWSNLSSRTGELYIGPGYVASGSPATCGGDADIDIRQVLATQYNEFPDMILPTFGSSRSVQSESDWTTPQSGNMSATEGTAIVICEIKASSARDYRFSGSTQRAILSFNGDWDSALQFYPSGGWGTQTRIFMGGDGGSQSAIELNMQYGPADTLIFAVSWKTGGQLYGWYRNVSRGEAFQFVTRAFGTWDLTGGNIDLFPNFLHTVVLRNVLIYSDQKSEAWFNEYLG